MAWGQRKHLILSYHEKSTGRVGCRCSWLTSLWCSPLHILATDVACVAFRCNIFISTKVPSSALSFLGIRYPCLKAPGQSICFMYQWPIWSHMCFGYPVMVRGIGFLWLTYTSQDTVMSAGLVPTSQEVHNCVGSVKMWEVMLQITSRQPTGSVPVGSCWQLTSTPAPRPLCPCLNSTGVSY